MKDFEESFSEFIDSQDYDKAEESLLKVAKEELFNIARAAFKAGWEAAKVGENIPFESDSDNKE